jgi:hypothetical protein
MSTSWIDGGVDAVCPSCGKTHHVLRPWCYAWKLNATVTPGVQKMLYCCSYTCWRKYQKDYEEIKRKRRSDAAYRRHGTKPKEDQDGGTG